MHWQQLWLAALCFCAVGFSAVQLHKALIHISHMSFELPCVEISVRLPDLCAGSVEYKRMLKHLKEPNASLSVIPEGIKGELSHKCTLAYSLIFH